MTVRVYVNDAGIQSMFLPAGDVNGFGRAIARTTTQQMRIFAGHHFRTGTLLRSFHTTQQVRHNKVRFVVSSSADHALKLERGTRDQLGWRKLYAGVLTGERRRAAAWPRWPGFIGVWVRNPRGTRATRFMSRALRRALHRHGLA